MATIGTPRLKIVNDQPSVEELQNGRFRLEFFCTNDGHMKDWYGDNISRILPQFGIKMGDKFGEGEWSLPDGAEYAGMTLVEAKTQFVPQAGTHYVKLVYETLTDAFVQEVDDVTDYELNGLRRVTRPLVAEAGVDYQKVVGTSTIQHQVDEETAVTLFLAGYKIEDTDAYRRVVETWMEAGTLSVTEKNLSDGVIEVSTSFFGVEGATIGPVISRGIGDFQGLQTINVTTLQDVDGNSVVDGGENLVNQVSGISSFTYPGVMDVEYIFTVSDKILNIQTLLKKSPAQSRVKTTTYFIFQNSSSLSPSDFTYLAATGLWSPNHWAAIYAEGIGGFGDEWNDSATFRGYRTSSESLSGNLLAPSFGDFAILRWQGVNVIRDGNSVAFSSTVDQGPPDPIGGVFTLDVQIVPAFDDVDGNKYYKKTIVVTDTIPDQPLAASLPYT